MGGEPVAATLRARTAASTSARRTATPPPVGTLTSIGLTGLPTSRPPREGPPETGTVTTIESMDSFMLSRIWCSAAATATRTASLVEHDLASESPCAARSLSAVRASRVLRAAGEGLHPRTCRAAGTATTQLSDASPLAANPCIPGQDSPVTAKAEGRARRQAVLRDRQVLLGHSIRPDRLRGRGASRRRWRLHRRQAQGSERSTTADDLSAAES
jgi:hypothetical protein